MRRILPTAALIALLGLAAPAQAADAGDPAGPAPILLGAYAPAAVDAPEVQDARNVAQTRLPALAQVQVATAYTQVVNLSRKQKMPTRLTALSLGIKRVQEAKRIRGLFP